METLSSYAVVQKYLEEKIGDRHMEHCVAILGKNLADIAKERAGHHNIRIQPSMSGRYTGLHAANLFTASLMGVNRKGVKEGARNMLEKCLYAESLDRNPALKLAALQYAMHNSGKKVFNTGVFSPRLVKYGDWRDQLMEESLGHNPSISFSTKTTELSNKLHSDFQNWIAGDNIFYHQFVFPLNSNQASIDVPGEQRTLDDIEYAAYLGTSEALKNAGRPSYTTFLESISPEAVGELMMRDMLATIYMGELFNLRNEPSAGGRGYFYQANVELYKNIMKDKLGDLTSLRDDRNDKLKLFGGR